jgi:hypothetical protein
MEKLLSNKWVLLGGVAVAAVILLANNRSAPADTGGGTGIASQQIAAGVDTSLSHDTVANNQNAFAYLASVAQGAAQVKVADIAANATIAAQSLNSMQNIVAVGDALEAQRLQSNAGVQIAQINARTQRDIEDTRASLTIALEPHIEALAKIQGANALALAKQQSSVAVNAQDNNLITGLLSTLGQPGAINNIVSGLFGGGTGSTASGGLFGGIVDAIGSIFG